MDNGMTENWISEKSDLLNTQLSNHNSDSEPRISGHKAMDERMTSYIAPSTNQLEDFTQPIKWMCLVHQAHLPQRGFPIPIPEQLI